MTASRHRLGMKAGQAELVREDEQGRFWSVGSWPRFTNWLGRLWVPLCAPGSAS